MKRVVFNQKGGVGKTTTCREIGIYFALLGFNVFFIDCDPQGNLTKSFKDSTEDGLYELLSMSVFEIMEVNNNISLVAGDKRLSALEKSLVGELDAFTRLKDAFDKDRFDEFD